MSDNLAESSYYLRFISMYIDLGTECLLITFKKLNPKTDVKTFLSTESARKKISELKRSNRLNQREYSTVTSTNPDINDFDISLLITLLTNFFTTSISEPVQGWKTHPDSSDQSIGAQLLRLKKIRNDIIGHHTKAKLSETKFNDLWAEITNTLLSVIKEVDLGNEDDFKAKISTYKTRPLDTQKCEAERLCREWWKEEIQNKVEEYLRQVNDFHIFFKNKSKHYDRYIKLVFDGGYLVCNGILKKELAKRKQSLQLFLTENRISLNNELSDEHFRQLFDANEIPIVDTEKWDILVFASCILCTLSTVLTEDQVSEIENIKDARTSYAETAMKTLNENKFSTCCENLVYSVKFLSSTIGREAKTQCQTLIEQYRTSEVTEEDDTDDHTYFAKLKSHGLHIVSMKEKYGELIQNLSNALTKMEEEGVEFPSDHILELKMITLGNNEQKKKLGEDILECVWKKALKILESGDIDLDQYPAVSQNVYRILEAIKTIPDAEPENIERHCIFLFIRCYSWRGILQALDYFRSNRFQQELDNISEEISREVGEELFIQGHITVDSMAHILENPRTSKKKPDEGLSLPIKVKSVKAMRQLVELSQTEEMSDLFKDTAASVSKEVDEELTLKIVPDLKEFSGVFENNATSAKSLRNECYKNWVKAGLGLKYLKQGLEPFTDEMVCLHHQDILKNHTSCSQCSLSSLLPDHAKMKTKKCEFGQTFCNCQSPEGKIPCPNDVCGHIYDCILRNHAFLPLAPNWKNTKVNRWCTSPWEIAKCFISTPGYQHKRNAYEIDASGLLQILRNNRSFHHHFQCGFAENDVFAKVLQTRNNIMHSVSMELTNAELDLFINDMIVILEDGKKLYNRKESKNMVLKLEELKQDNFVITSQLEADVVRSSIASVKLEDSAGGTYLTRQFEYIQQKQDFQKVLINLYKEHHITFTATPLLHEQFDDHLLNLYVTPFITMPDKMYSSAIMSTATSGVRIGKAMTSVSDIFNKDGKKSIYVIGECGTGKTTFCRKLISDWCLFQSNKDSDFSYSGEDNYIETMRNHFDFVFYIPLRDHMDNMDISTMLKTQYNHRFLKSVLENEASACLIILDGFDEWSKPEHQYPGIKVCQSRRIPTRNLKEGCTYLTTTRPWRLGVLDLAQIMDSTECVFIHGISRQDSEAMVIQQTNLLNQMYDSNKSPYDFMNKLNESHVSSMINIPLILSQLISLWYDDSFPYSSNRCEIYSSIVNLLLKKTSRMFCGDLEINLATVQNLDQFQIPGSVRQFETPDKFLDLLVCLAKLAFDTLFGSGEDQSQVIANSTFHRFDITNDGIQFCLKAGLLSQDKTSLLANSQRYAFTHKTFQDYFAALYCAMSVSDEVLLHISHLELDDLLERSTVLALVCGLKPIYAKQVSRYMFESASEDKRVFEYRNTFDDLFEETVNSVQDAVLQCIEEIGHFNDKIYLGDFVLNSAMSSDTVEIINFSDIVSINIDTREIAYLNEFCVVFQHLYFCEKLQSIKIKDVELKLEGWPLDQIMSIVPKNALNLRSLYLQLTPHVMYKSLFETFVFNTGNMENLEYVQLDYIAASNDCLQTLCTYLSEQRKLKFLALTRIRQCDSFNNTYSIDLSKQSQLQCLKLDCRTFNIENVNVSFLETVKLYSLSTDKLRLVKDQLISANLLSSLDLEESYSEGMGVSISEHLAKMLVNLERLNSLKICGFTIDSNIITSPFAMRNLQLIELCDATLPLSTWCAFVDSLSALPRIVKVKAWMLTITPGAEREAYQYVRKKRHLFHVTNDSKLHFEFSTCKSMPFC